jgi:GAF domain-containing protein
LRQVSRELNALARNLVGLLQLGRSDRLQWQQRDAALVETLASRVEVLARALQTYRAAGDKNAFVKVSDLPAFVSDG